MNLDYVGLSRKPKEALGLLVMLALAGFGATSVSAAPTIRILRGSDQQTTYASAFPAPLVAWVVDSVTQRALSGLRVDFNPGSGIGLSSTYAITDGSGLATVNAAGLAACDSVVTAAIAGTPGATVTFEGLTVNKAVLAVVPGNLESVVGSDIPAVTTYTIEGFVNGDTLETANITGSPVLTTTATNHSPYANYAIKGGPGTLAAPNYTFVAGFGVLAMLPGAKSGAGANSVQEAAVNPAPSQHAVILQAALVSGPTTVAIPQPTFVAGLRGSSGVFVRDAIWPKPSSTVATQQLSETRSALKVDLATAKKTSGEPVRAVVLPKSAPVAGSALLVSSTKSAMPAVAAPTRKMSKDAVRSAALPSQPVAAVSVQSSFSGAEIRKALIVPGTN